jgi:hypothetical protein
MRDRLYVRGVVIDDQELGGSHQLAQTSTFLPTARS